MKVVVGIMGCPVRSKHIQSIVDYLKHRGTMANVLLDHERKGPWWNARRFLSSMEGDFGILIQDDVLFNEYSWENIRKVVFGANIETCCSVYSPIVKVPELCEQGVRYIKSPSVAWGQCLIFNREMIPDLLSWEQQNMKPTYYSYDRRIGAYLRFTRQDAIVTVPSIVDHANNDSLLGHPLLSFGRGRVSSMLAEKVYDWDRTEENTISRPSNPISFYTPYMLPGRGKWDVQ